MLRREKEANESDRGLKLRKMTKKTPKTSSYLAKSIAFEGEGTCVEESKVLNHGQNREQGENGMKRSKKNNI